MSSANDMMCESWALCLFFISSSYFDGMYCLEASLMRSPCSEICCWLLFSLHFICLFLFLLISGGSFSIKDSLKLHFVGPCRCEFTSGDAHKKAFFSLHHTSTFDEIPFFWLHIHVRMLAFKANGTQVDALELTSYTMNFRRIFEKKLHISFVCLFVHKGAKSCQASLTNFILEAREIDCYCSKSHPVGTLQSPKSSRLAIFFFSFSSNTFRLSWKIKWN